MNASRFPPEPWRHLRLVVVLASAAAGACAATPAAGPVDVLDLSGYSDEAAAGPLARFLLDQGYRVRLAGPMTVEAGTDTVSATFSPVLQDGGLDRLVATRRFPAQPGLSAADLGAFAEELNASLNVGVFVADAGDLLYQTHATFLDVISEAEVRAFLAWMGQVELAIGRVEDGRELLIWTTEL